jgi:hypothetical protein
MRAFLFPGLGDCINEPGCHWVLVSRVNLMRLTEIGRLGKKSL